MLTINFHPFPVLATERLWLKQIVMEDADQLLKLRSDKSVMKYIPRKPAESIEDALQLIVHFDGVIHHNDKITWGLYLKETDELIGTIGYVTIYKDDFRAEIGYLLRPDHQGKGLMTEALQAVVGFGFNTLNFHTIEAIVHPDNKPSAKILKSNQFIKEAYLKESQFFNGKFIDSIIYSRTNPIQK